MTPARSALTTALAAALAVELAGCASHDTVATLVPGSRPLTGPVLPDGSCAAALVRRYFGKAVCVCNGASLSSDLVTDGFDSRVGRWVAGGAGGDVGFVSGGAFSGLLQVGGSLAVSGMGLESGSTLRVAGDLEVGGNLARPNTTATVGGSARIAGSVGVDSLTVGGTLTVPPDATFVGSVTAGSIARAAVDVAPACPCDAGSALDVGGFIAQRRLTNDDAAIGLAPDALSLVSTPISLQLPPGSFYLDRVQGSASISLRALGRAALYIANGVTVSGPLAIELDPGAELDIFVAGPVNLPGSARIGDPARPGALRLWVSAGGNLNVPSDAQFASLLYAPAADLNVTVPTDIFGAVFVSHIQNGAALSVHYDRAVAAAPATCN